MNKETKFEINGKKEFLAVIDEIGDLQVEIAERTAKIKHRLDAAAEWALEHPKEAFPDGGCGRTKKYNYIRKASPRALRRLPDVSQKRAADLLLADEKMAKYVFTDYDTKELAKDFGCSREKRESVKDFGLFFTEPGKDRLEVLS